MISPRQLSEIAGPVLLVQCFANRKSEVNIVVKFDHLEKHFVIFGEHLYNTLFLEYLEIWGTCS